MKKTTPQIQVMKTMYLVQFKNCSFICSLHCVCFVNYIYENQISGADSHGEEISSEEEQAAVDSNEDCDPDSRTVSLKSTKALKRKKPSKKA